MKKVLVSIAFSIIFFLILGCGRSGSSPLAPNFYEANVFFSSPLCLTSGDLGFIKPHLLMDEDGVLMIRNFHLNGRWHLLVFLVQSR